MTSTWNASRGLAASGEPVFIELCVTMVYRREDGEWKVAHRHADPITTARPVSTMVRATS